MQFRKTWLMALALTGVVALSACGGNNGGNKAASNNGGNTPAATNTEASSGAKLSGSILASGSTALQPLVEQVAEKFMETNSGVDIQVQGGGSGTGLTQVSEKQVDIGNSDVFAEEKLKDAAKAAELKDHQVAVVAIAAVSNPAAGVDSLTKQQLVDIFTGKITNWKEVGGADQAIQIINRPASSGTRATFESFALGTKTEDLKGSIQEDSSGTVKKMIGETPGAIGYLALSYLDDTVKTLNYDGVEPSVDNVVAGKYPVWAYEHMYTNGEPNETVKAFLDYFMTDDVQTGDVVELGYIPASKMQVTRDVAGTVTPK
ncbi:phosphate ABC transporter substrate-binding protein PstS family protein [Paenibacillus piscarius]|uniref:phosphate ABC transporter substrate-binding protein PstS family protein n=1 Tax=Paenibacillus piscarius TaxID=1089681 RepID=UPI001EE895AA|nr:phosphate ABC transporter substrate-binding protein PstS family protein [Paenibacillus piscarius]